MAASTQPMEAYFLSIAPFSLSNNCWKQKTCMWIKQFTWLNSYFDIHAFAEFYKKTAPYELFDY